MLILTFLVKKKKINKYLKGKKSQLFSICIWQPEERNTSPAAVAAGWPAEVQEAQLECAVLLVCVPCGAAEASRALPAHGTW